MTQLVPVQQAILDVVGKYPGQFSRSGLAKMLVGAKSWQERDFPEYGRFSQYRRKQILLESRLDDHGSTLEEHTRRLETIEADMHQGDRYISENQATQISQAIKAIAIAMGKRTGRNEFGAI